MIISTDFSSLVTPEATNLLLKIKESGGSVSINSNGTLDFDVRALSIQDRKSAFALSGEIGLALAFEALDSARRKEHVASLESGIAICKVMKKSEQTNA